MVRPASAGDGGRDNCRIPGSFQRHNRIRKVQMSAAGSKTLSATCRASPEGIYVRIDEKCVFSESRNGSNSWNGALG